MTALAATGRAATGTSPRVPPGAWFLGVLVLVLVLTQRLAVPLGSQAQIPLDIPIFLALSATGVVTGRLTVSRPVSRMLGLAITTLAVLTLVAVARGENPSLTSFGLFVAIYLPAVGVASSPAAAGWALRFFVDLMIVAAAVGLILFVLQFVGLGYQDYLAQIVPPNFLQRGYNTADPLRYGSPIFRSSAVIFLEPSFFSLFLGLAASISVVLGHRRVFLPLLICAIASTLAGNGLLLLAVVAVWVFLVGPRRRLAALVPSVATAVGFSLLTPLAQLIRGRSDEIGAQDSSSSLRLVQPYQRLLPQWIESTTDSLIGHGAGFAQRVITGEAGGAAVIVPAVPKLLVEYGVVGAVPTLAFLLVLHLRRVWDAPWAVGLVPLYFVVNASLLQSTLAAASILFCSMLVPARLTMPVPQNVAASDAAAGQCPDQDFIRSP